jgi:hypothetical protein
MRHHVSCVGLLVAMVVLAHPRVVFAAEPSSAPGPDPVPGEPPKRPVSTSDDGRDEDFAAFRAMAVEQAARNRAIGLGGGLASLGGGAVLGGAGAVMLSRESAGAGAVMVAGGIALGATGSLGLLGDILSADPFEVALAEAMKVRAAGGTQGAALRRGEAVLWEAARDERSSRLVGGALFSGLGIVAVGVGAALTLADFTRPTFTRREQDVYAGAFVGFGTMGVLVGVESLLVPSRLESIMSGYSPRSAPIGVRVVPSARGVGVGLSGTF